MVAPDFFPILHPLPTTAPPPSFLKGYCPSTLFPQLPLHPLPLREWQEPVTMYSSTFGMGWVGRSCLYLLVWVSFGSLSLRELTCMHCVYLALWTRKVLCGSFYALYILKKSFIHSVIEPCFGIGHNLSLICQLTSEDIKQLFIMDTHGSPAERNLNRIDITTPISLHIVVIPTFFQTLHTKTT